MVKDNYSNSYTSLKTRSKQSCDFCVAEFNDRYSCIVHNASHIIIPLLKQTLYCCDTCYVYFTNVDAFDTHMIKRHHNVIKEGINTNIRQPEIKLENLLMLDDTVKIKQEAVDIEMDLLSSDDEFICDMIKKEMKDGYMENIDHKIKESIKNKIKFEDDCEIELLRQFTTECKVNLHSEWSYNNNMYNDKYRVNNIAYKTAIDELECDNFVLRDSPLLCEEEFESVHYSELMSVTDAGCICRYCKLSFTNRYCLILHETKHLRFTRTRNRILVCVLCDRYVAGNYRNLNKHQVKKHGGPPRRRFTLSKCSECHLPYRKYHRHISIYHRRTCDTGLKDSRDDTEMTGQRCGDTDHHRHMKVCDLCYSLITEKSKKKYIVTGKISEERLRCHRCENTYDELKTVKRIEKVEKAERMKKVKKRLTNEDRLKNIQHRLKMINKLSKFYMDVVLLCTDFKNERNEFGVCVSVSLSVGNVIFLLNILKVTNYR